MHAQNAAVADALTIPAGAGNDLVHQHIDTSRNVKG